MAYTFTDKEKQELCMYKQSIADKKVLRRLEAIELRAMGKHNREISEQTGFHTQYITVLVSRYKREGIEGLLSKYGPAER